MYFLDTDTLTLAHAGHPGITQRIQRTCESNIATTVVTAVEIRRGRQEFLLKASDGVRLLRAQQLPDLSEELLEEIQIVPADIAAAEAFDNLRRERRLKKMGRSDLLIASIAISHDATIVTRNIKHFKIVPRLRIENWVD